MARYRLFFFDGAHRIERKFMLDCDSDAQAVGHARATGHPHKIEVYQGTSLVTRLTGAVAGDH